MAIAKPQLKTDWAITAVVGLICLAVGGVVNEAVGPWRKYRKECHCVGMKAKGYRDCCEKCLCGVK